jgi:hypothetical protein
MSPRVASSIVLGVFLLAAAPAVPGPAPSAGDVVADTGIVSLGPNQVLRVTAVFLLPYIEQENIFRFRRMEYSAGACTSGVCALSVASQTTSAPVTVPPGGAATLEVPGGSAGSRVLLLSAGRGTRMTAQVVDATTGQIICVLIGL